jgi:sporulation protein YlmC with PRC-barrel domain
MHEDRDDVIAKRDMTDKTTYTGTTTGYTESIDTRREAGRGARSTWESTKERASETWESERVHNRRVLSSSSLAGDRVRNNAGEDLGKIEEIMIDIHGGRVAYAVLSFGGFLGMGNKLFAVPWGSLSVDLDNHEFVLDVQRETLENAPGFDKSDWPDMADPDWGAQIHQHYGRTPYWEHDEKGVNLDKGEMAESRSSSDRDRGGVL